MNRLIALGWLAPALLPTLAFAQDNVLIDRGRPQPSNQPPPAMTAEPVRPPPAVSAVVAPNIKFTRVEIIGPPAPVAVERAWRPLIGRGLDANNLRAIADKVAAAYGKSTALYTVFMPSQDFRDGVVRLQIVQGHIEEAIIAGKVKDRDMSLIKGYTTALQAEKPLSRATLERYISLIRDIPGLTPDIQLLQGRTPGGVKLLVGVKEKRFDWTVTVNNRGSDVLDREQASVDFVWNSTFRQGDQSRLTVASSLDGTSQKAVAGGHSTPLGKKGARLDLSGAWQETELAGGAIKGTATSLGASVSYPLIRGYRDNLYISGGIDGVDSDNATLGLTSFTEHTRNLRGSAAYSRARAKEAISLSLVVTQGLDGLGAQVNPLLAESDYFKAVIRAGYDRKLSDTVTVRLRGAAQLSSDILPVTEQFGLGGDVFGRGFANSLLLGDKGSAASIETGWAPKAIKGTFKGSEIYGFYDAGEVRTNDRPTIPGGHENLASAGGGVRLAIKPGYVVGIEAAKPVDAPGTIADRWRYGFSLRSNF